eukprot:8836572-Pyramimonas_sp.AAC.2
MSRRRIRWRRRATGSQGGLGGGGWRTREEEEDEDISRRLALVCGFSSTLGSGADAFWESLGCALDVLKRGRTCTMIELDLRLPQAVNTVWESLMNIAFGSEDKPAKIILRVDPDWHCRWPRPDVHGAPVLEVEVDRCGCIHIGELATGSSPARSCLATMVRKLTAIKSRHDMTVDGKLAIATFTKARDAPSQSLGRQIAWAFAIKLEAALGKQVKGRGGGEDFAWAEPEGEGKFSMALDLVKYVLGGRNAAMGHHTFVATMDECEGIGMTLVNMVVGLHDN